MTKRKTYASKKTTRQLVEMSPKQIRRLSEASLKSVVQKLGRTVSTRRRAAEKAGIYSDVLQNTHITTRGLTREQLYGQYIKAREALQAETTVSELRDISERVRRGMEHISGQELSDEDVYDAMKAFSDLIRQNPDTSSRDMRYKAYIAIAEISGQGLSVDEMVRRANDELRDYRREIGQTISEMSSFFTT